MLKCLHEFLDFHARIRADVMFASDDVQTLTYGEAKAKVDCIADRLNQLSLKKGDRVALLGKNSANQLLIYLACSRLGIVPLGLNYRLAPGEWRYIVEDAQAKCLFIDSEFVALLEPACAELPRVLLVDDEGGKKQFDEWLGDAEGVYPEVKIEGDDILFQMYTSGTTGRPKGALLSHDNVINCGFQVALTSGVGAKAGDRTLLVAPLFHAAGLVSTFAGMVYGTSLFIHREYDPVRMVEVLSEEKIAGITVIPVMLQFSIACVPNIAEYDFSELKLITYGASPISADLLKQSMGIFNCDFAQGYGQTEATAVLTCLTPDDHRRALKDKPELLSSCGKALCATEIRVVNDAGEDVPAGEMGEIIVRGPQVMKAYWNNAEATASTLKDGWLSTGDAGRMDEEGYLYIQDRVKDMIISGGENIYPAEIENVLMSHPNINEVAVIGVPNEKWGEVPLTVLVRGDEPLLDVKEIEEHCRPHLAGYKIPKLLEYIDALPRNPTGKVLKKELRARFQ